MRGFLLYRFAGVIERISGQRLFETPLFGFRLFYKSFQAERSVLGEAAAPPDHF
jgi:hypothetical protein